MRPYQGLLPQCRWLSFLEARTGGLPVESADKQPKHGIKEALLNVYVCVFGGRVGDKIVAQKEGPTVPFSE